MISSDVICPCIYQLAASRNCAGGRPTQLPHFAGVSVLIDMRALPEMCASMADAGLVRAAGLTGQASQVQPPGPAPPRGRTRARRLVSPASRGYISAGAPPDTRESWAR